MIKKGVVKKGTRPMLPETLYTLKLLEYVRGTNMLSRNVGTKLKIDDLE